MTAAKKTVTAMTLAGALLFLAADITAGETTVPRVIETTVAAHELTAMMLDARVGEVELEAYDADTILVHIELDHADSIFGDRATRAAIASAELVQERNGKSLELRLHYPKGDSDDVREHWQIKVPARFAVEADMAVGELRIRGVRGGVVADLGVGDVDIDVPAGRIEAEVSVGDLSIHSATPSPGRITLEASVGDVSLALDGQRVPVERGFGPGAEIMVAKDGSDSIDASVSVGNLSVTVD
ncbi:MAG TPA: hypothetical protein VNL72_00655 [Gammaproteobacteria bacterium]|nr:hypothetical protein [Gammaproteobacteria bacterium]